jgi:hypothetical protein
MAVTKDYKRKEKMDEENNRQVSRMEITSHKNNW